ncbi:MAG TPA: M14 family zinc carboxypeptidase [Actinomycetota bacterium]
MTRRILSLLTVVAMTVPALVGAIPASAGPVQCSELPPTPDQRVFPEPRVSATYVRFDEFECGIEFLEWKFRDLIDIVELGKSKDYLPIYDIRLTDEKNTQPKRKLLVVNAMHGNELAGREGAVRNIEDMVDPRFLANEPWVQQVLDEFVIHFLFPNPDGWVAGDVLGTPGAGVSFTRGNGSGKDLNRQFPVKGYIYTPNTTLSEPEGNVVIEKLFTGEGKKDWYLGTDNHGQGADTYAAAGLQIVGQFDYQKSETLARFADEIDDAMAEYGVLSELQQLKDLTGEDLGPYHWGTLYDMLGYSASGSLIDYYNTVDDVAGTGFATEMTVGQENNTLAYQQVLNQVHVDSVRAINYTMFKQAIDPKTFTYELGGKVAYVFDPDRIRDDDANGSGYVRKPGEDIPQRPYDVSRMTFFEDLSENANEPLTPVRVGDLLSDPSDEDHVDLASFDSLILANEAMPEPGDATAYYGLLKDWVEAGGNLVVTDAAVSGLAEMGLIPTSAVTSQKHYVGYVDFGDRSHPLNAGLRGVARQTYDSVPIGYAFPPAGSNCPVYRVSSSAWSAAGGYTAGTNGGTSNVAYGQMPVGDGMVRFIGALLPDPTEAFYHPYGLQNYAVTYTGYTILQNSLDWQNPARAD